MRFKPQIEWFDEVDSTNNVVRGREPGSIVIARHQTAGRGQRGNTWSSEADANLTFSIMLDTSWLPASLQFLLSEAVALSVVDGLASHGIDAMVKWPNDIYVGDRKIAGILIENDIRGEFLSRSVVGVGLNVNQTEFPPELPNPTSMLQVMGKKEMSFRGAHEVGDVEPASEASLSMHSSRQGLASLADSTPALRQALNDMTFDLQTVLNTFLRAFEQRMRALERGELPEAEYAAKLWRRGVAADYSTPDGERFAATIRGVLPTGELVLDTAAGEKQFLFKEVEFVL